MPLQDDGGAPISHVDGLRVRLCVAYACALTSYALAGAQGGELRAGAARVKPEFQSRAASWTRGVEDAILRSVRQASDGLQPARFGVAKGKAYVNTNRRAPMADGSWGLGMNPQGPSDKTLAAVKFERLSGEPIAILMNYPVHGTVMGPRNHLITGDLPGAATQYVEQRLGDRAVALWTSAASGEQNPIYATQDRFDRVDALARILGEETLRLLPPIRTTARARIWGAQRVVTCPGQKRADASAPPRPPIRFLEAEPVAIRLSLLRVGHAVLAGVAGEVLTMIGERLKAESPFANTFMVTHCNDAVGYIPDDAAYDQVSYEIVVSPLERGCAENAIVNALVEMMEQP
ncbi:MAG: neutral/alkaline non-lysosomal ceramidase N-terminal domain-containing protein [Bryobacterales bacterium]|nr:neutral/alkaline non-lysosomal ceramidase N-terminal domain-containing protein [Bryobacteraceae bacterium]MDW8129677.1 neutral/alkaline non-lysosomal ceramidase N-terminal domain-containing protein [Bryobacterales bacterium]